MTRFTIITITYNAEKVVQRTLDSVLQQTYEDVEHLIVDGASTDKTMELAQAYKQKSDASAGGHKVILRSEPDEGIYDAMNKGLRSLDGDYVCFLNAGDFLPAADTVSKIVGYISLAAGEENMPAVLYGDTDIVDGEGRFLHHRRLSPPENLSWKSFRQGMLVCHQAFYARLDIARDIPYDLQYRHSADVDWCIRVMKEAERRHLPLVRVQGVVADFLDGGDSSKNHRASLRERFHVMRRHYGLLTTCLMHVWFLLRSVFR